LSRPLQLCLLARSVHKRLEEIARGFIALKAALWVPLHCQHIVPGQRSLNRFDGPIVRASSRYAQSVANNVGRLMMA
jgi:hypothetical protein